MSLSPKQIAIVHGGLRDARDALRALSRTLEIDAVLKVVEETLPSVKLGMSPEKRQRADDALKMANRQLSAAYDALAEKGRAGRKGPLRDAMLSAAEALVCLNPPSAPVRATELHAA